MKSIFVMTLVIFSNILSATELQVELVPIETQNIVIARRSEKGHFDVYNFKNEIIGYNEFKNPIHKKVMLGKIKEVFCSKAMDDSFKFDAKAEKECLQKIVENYDLVGDKK